LDDTAEVRGYRMSETIVPKTIERATSSPTTIMICSLRERELFLRRAMNSLRFDRKTTLGL